MGATVGSRVTLYCGHEMTAVIGCCVVMRFARGQGLPSVTGGTTILSLRQFEKVVLGGPGGQVIGQTACACLISN